MTTKQAALLAAVGTTVHIVTPSISMLSALVTHGAWYGLTAVLNVLFMLLQGVVFLGPILVFFVCVYLDKPPLVIPERLRRPALVAAIAAGLSAAYTAFSAIRGFIGSLDIAGISLMRASHPLQWFLQWPMSGLIRIFAAVGVPPFFFAVARSATAPQDLSPRLKKAAKYAGILAIASAIYTICMLSLQIFYSEYSTLGARLRFALPHISLSLFYNGSLAWFFFLFYRTVPTTQSSQRLSSGE